MLNVVSLFHGMGCLNIAMNRANIRTGFVYTSEIDKYATKVDIVNNPDNIRMGDVRNWREWGIDWSSVDLVTAGSPCQGFSSAGKQGGTKAIIDGVETVISTREQYTDAKQRGAEFLSQSHLFWEFVLLLDVVRVWNPNVKFMLENVKMSRNNLDMITEALGVEPVLLRSEHHAAVVRDRLYWCNWYVPPLPVKNIQFGDIREWGIPLSSGLYYSDKAFNWLANHAVRKGKDFKVYTNKGKFQMLEASMHKKYSSQRFYGILDNYGVRYPSVLECERMHSVPEGYCSGVSKTQAYMMLGNGWEIKTIQHLLENSGL